LRFKGILEEPQHKLRTHPLKSETGRIGRGKRRKEQDTAPEEGKRRKRVGKSGREEKTPENM
jgi:hypothetical protein